MNGATTDIEAILEEELTPEQRVAAADDGTDVFVIACAGSGKSRTLAYRIAWLIRQLRTDRPSPTEVILRFTCRRPRAETSPLSRVRSRPPDDRGGPDRPDVHRPNFPECSLPVDARIPQAPQSRKLQSDINRQPEWAAAGNRT